jgi:hypothetical protein
MREEAQVSSACREHALLFSTELGGSMNSYRRINVIKACAGLTGAVLALTPLAVSAQNAPLSHVANPDVYKVLGENDQFRVVLGTWKPGQRDTLHSHPANATYALTGCNLRLYGPDNKVLMEGARIEGSTVLQAPVAAHTFENTGASDCQILIVERK